MGVTYVSPINFTNMKTYNKPNTKLLSLSIKKSVLEDDMVPAISSAPEVEPIDWNVNQSQFNDAIDDFMK